MIDQLNYEKNVHEFLVKIWRKKAMFLQCTLISITIHTSQIPKRCRIHNFKMVIMFTSFYKYWLMAADDIVFPF